MTATAATTAVYRGSRGPIAEVRRLRAELAAARADRDRLAAMVRGHLAADPLDQLAALWAAYARESYDAGRADALAEIASVWPSWPPLTAISGPAAAELEARRWPVRGELRTRGTFADPHPDDHSGTDSVL